MQVDCTAEVELCREHQITGFPSIRVFRAGAHYYTVQTQEQKIAQIGKQNILVLFWAVQVTRQPHALHRLVQLANTYQGWPGVNAHISLQGMMRSTFMA